MIPHFIKHKIRLHDSLASLASRMRMTEEQLKEFHNQNCEKMDKLWFTSLKGVEFILIPTVYVSREEEEMRKKKMLPPVKYFSGFHASKYIATETFKESAEEDVRFNYSVILNIENGNDGFVAETSTEDFTKNGAVSEDKVSSLLLACMNSIYPISYKLLQNGKLQSCCNHQILIERFKNKRTDIEDFFIGEVSKNYMDLLAGNLSKEDYFFRQMQSTLLYQSLFPNLEWFHQYTFWTEEFFVYNNSFPLQFNFQSEYIFDNSDVIETKISGTLSENCSLRELVKGIRIEDEDIEENIDAEIQIEYFTNKTTRQLHEVKSSVSIWHRNELFQKHDLHLTQK